LLAIWRHVGDETRRMLDSYTLADVAQMAEGGRPWPANSD